MLDAGHAECGWLPEGDKFWVSNPEGLASRVIPLYYEHHSYASFTRSLNAYSFYKMSPSTWAHPLFHRDYPHLAQQITRKATPAKSKQRKERGEQQLRKQLDKEQKALAAAANEVSRLESELAVAKQQAQAEQSLLDTLERQAVDHVTSLADTPTNQFDHVNVSAQDFGLSDQDLISVDELLDPDADSETEETEAAEETGQGSPYTPAQNDECEALVDEMISKCKLMGYQCPIANAKDEELFKQSNCQETRRQLEAYVQQIKEAKAAGKPIPPTPPFLLMHKRQSGQRSPNSVMESNEKCAVM